MPEKKFVPPPAPEIGDRVYVKPSPGEMVQRGANMFEQFLPPAGAWVIWDSFHVSRLCDGSIRPTSPPEGEANAG